VPGSDRLIGILGTLATAQLPLTVSKNSERKQSSQRNARALSHPLKTWGGLGEVHLAQDTKLDREVAIKFLHEEFSKDTDKLGRFIQEAKAASALNHPNILTVYEIGEVDGKNYIATELIDGSTLREHLAHKESLQLNQILAIGVQVSEAVSAAHQAAIIHRDLREGVPTPDIYDPTLNPLYRDLLAHYGTVAMPCRVRHPDRKGKVEAGVGHAQKTPLKGQRFESLEEAQAYLDHWETRWADTRIHGTTKRPTHVSRP